MNPCWISFAMRAHMLRTGWRNTTTVVLVWRPIPKETDSSCGSQPPAEVHARPSLATAPVVETKKQLQEALSCFAFPFETYSG